MPLMPKTYFPFNSRQQISVFKTYTQVKLCYAHSMDPGESQIVLCQKIFNT